MSEDQFISKEVLDLLNNPNLVSILINETNKFVVGVEESILAIGLNACGRLVENSSKTSYNVIPNDDSGTGKDFVTENTLKIFVPEDKLVTRTRITPSLLNYWHNPEKEPDWTWDEKVLYLKDVSDNILNSEVMKTFTSEQTTATILIKQEAFDIEIKGKPCIFLTTANSTPGQEQLRRFSFIPLDGSEEQTKRIMHYNAKRAQGEIKPQKDKIILEAITLLGRVSVDVPYAELLVKYFPNELIARTVFGTFIDLIKASAALHQFQRQKGANGFVVANFEDYEYANKVLTKLTSRGGLIPITKNQRKLLDIINFKLDKNTTSRIVKTYSFWAVIEIKEKVNFLTDANLYLNLGSLANNGFLDKGEKEIIVSKSVNDSNEQRGYSKDMLAYCIKEKEEFILPSKEVLLNEWVQTQNAVNNCNINNTANMGGAGSKENKVKEGIGECIADIGSIESTEPVNQIQIETNKLKEAALV